MQWQMLLSVQLKQFPYYILHFLLPLLVVLLGSVPQFLVAPLPLFFYDQKLTPHLVSDISFRRLI